jgi:hypothetical protein
MRSHRATVAAVALAALATASAAPAKNTVTIGGSFVKPLRPAAVPTPVAAKDTRHSCQAGASRKRIILPGPASVSETERKAAVVACEQPPRSHLNVSGALQTAQTGGIAAVG